MGNQHSGRWYDLKAIPIKAYHLIIINDITNQEKRLIRQNEILSIATHELKAPVTSIKAYTQLVKTRLEKGQDQQNALLLGRADQQVDRLVFLIQDLLDRGKISAGTLQINRRPTDVNRIIKKVVADYRRIAPTHRYQTWLQPGIKIPADADRLEQVLINLISNAVRYSPENSLITVGAKPYKTRLRLFVKDEGEGIPPEKIPDLFKPFTQIRPQTQIDPRSTGLGLYICYEIVRQHRGRIRVKSRVGKGTTFNIYLPVTDNQAKPG